MAHPHDRGFNIRCGVSHFRCNRVQDHSLKDDRKVDHLLGGQRFCARRYLKWIKAHPSASPD
jgi:hypothetical protein